jgi:hypothetical protein
LLLPTISLTFVYAPVGGFIKTVIRVLRCVGHYNSKILLDKVRQQLLLHICGLTECAVMLQR